jgi:signal transduction histidine kinase
MSSRFDKLILTIDGILERRRFFMLNVVLLSALVVLAFWVSWRNLGVVKRIVVNDFNQRQLNLARHIAGEVESSIDEIRDGLRFRTDIEGSPGDRPSAEREELAARYDDLRDAGVVRIYYVPSGGPVMMSDADGVSVANDIEVEKSGLYAKMRESSATGVISGGGEFQRDGEGRYFRTLEIGALYGMQDGAVYFLLAVVDITRMIGTIAQDATSGEIGYSWIIDENCRFLSHPNNALVGRVLYEAWEDITPQISDTRFNQLQEERMLSGEEGTGRYTSGWQSGRKDDVEELIAYSPVRIDDADGVWSVAVLVPESEMRAKTQGMYLRQAILEGLLIGGIFAVSFMGYAYKRRLSILLGRKLEQTTRSLHQTEEYYHAIFESAQDPIYLIDRDLRFISMNMFTAKTLRHLIAARTGQAEAATLGPEQLAGVLITDILEDDDAEFIETKIRKVFLKKIPETFEHRSWVGDRRQYFNTRYIPIFGEDASSVSSVLGISRDVTEKKEMQHLIYNAEKLASVGTLAAGVAHEINNPLGVILGFTDLLLARAKEGSQEHEDLKIIEENCLNCKRIVENLMSFARVTEGIEEVVDLNNAVKSVIRIVQNTLLTTKIELKLGLKDDLPVVRGDAREIQQVFFNLVNNAVYAMRESGGELLINSIVRPQSVEIHFVDRGVGIPAGIGDRIFDPFFTTKEVGEGTGLGLSVSYGILQKYGGSISYTSVARTEVDDVRKAGTTFVVTLPIYERDEGADEAEAPEEHARHKEERDATEGFGS